MAASRVYHCGRSSFIGIPGWFPRQGGEPRRWLRNASGLVWSGPRQVLFSEMEMGKLPTWESSRPRRAGSESVMFTCPRMPPAWRTAPIRHPMGNGCFWWKWTVTTFGCLAAWFRWMARSQGRQVGPPEAACTVGAWSPDGRWMYLSSEAGGLYHIWRQRFPDGQPEQVTSGPTEEEGMAMAPDGRSFVTAVALENVSVWLHDARGERQISLEGNAADPKFTPDGKKLCYRIITKTLRTNSSLVKKQVKCGWPTWNLDVPRHWHPDSRRLDV